MRTYVTNKLTNKKHEEPAILFVRYKSKVKAEEHVVLFLTTSFSVSVLSS
jgi:hypothetical protein